MGPQYERVFSLLTTHVHVITVKMEDVLVHLILAFYRYS